MVNKHRPFISTNNVRAALSSLIHPSPESGTNPLAALLIVDNFLVVPDFPATSKAREFALQHILTTIITGEYQQIREVYGNTIVGEGETRAEAITSISLDAGRDSVELIAWSWLYYHYVCVNLNISPHDFSHIAGFDERTLRRYQQQGIERLTDCLINLEWKARAEQRKRRLISDLPVPVSPHLVGRENEIAAIQSILNTDLSAHILITGMAGIGKSSLALYILHHQIEMDALDNIVWINDSQSIQGVEDTLIEHLLPQESGISLKEYAAVFAVAVVLDNASQLLHNETAKLNDFLTSLSKMQIILTSDTQPNQLILSTHNFYLRELRPQAAIQLAEDTSKMVYLDGSKPEFTYEQIGGNPLVIQLVVRNPHQSFVNAAAKIQEIFSVIAIRFDEITMMCWYALALTSPIPISLFFLRKIWPQITFSSLETLSKHSIVDINFSRQSLYQLSDSSGQYIKMIYRDSPEIRSIITDLLLSIEFSNSEINEALLSIMERALSSDWIILSDKERDTLIERWSAIGIQMHRCGVWAAILEKEMTRHVDVPLSYLIAYGVCLRSLARWDEAFGVLMRAVSIAGQKGFFERQAGAILEAAIVLRHRGEYEQALQLLARASRVAKRRHLLDLMTAINCEYMQTALDLGDLDECEKLIHQLPDNSQALLLQSEVFLRRGDWITCHEFIHRFIQTADLSELSRARGLSILGQLYNALGDLDAAHLHLTQAVTLLEQMNDPFALARAQTNLSVIFIAMAIFEDAYALLLRAESLQTLINDPVGLATTKHNFYILAGQLNG